MSGGSRRLRRLLDRFLAGALLATAKIFAAVPSRFSRRAARGVADVVYLLDRRGRRVGRDNLRAIFGKTKSAAERRRILRASYRTAASGVWALLRFRSLSPAEYARWVRVDPEDERFMREAAERVKQGVMVSAHFGNWELLLAARTGIPYSPRVHYLSESTHWPAVDAALDRLRDRGAGSGALRKGGALALRRAIEDGKSVGILIDRNVREYAGGVYVPFLGLPARTSPLPALLARRYGLPMGVMLCMPDGPDRWRVWLSRNVMGEPTEDEDADIRAALARANELLGDAIRRQPEAWLWMIKRWKSRPTEEQGDYPAYSLHDPDR